MRKIDSKQKLESGLERLRMILDDLNESVDKERREKRRKYAREYYHRRKEKALAAARAANKGKPNITN